MNLNNLKKTFIIAEIGNNHEGSFNVACKLIKEAKKAGADAVKFQTFSTEYLVNKSEKERFSKLKKFELSKKEFVKLAKYSKKTKLKFVSTPFDLESAKFLSKIVDVFKISSGDNNFFELIDQCAFYKKPLIISTGLIDYVFVKKIFNHLKKNKFPLKKLAFLHCVSDYPVKISEANLLSIKFLLDKFKVTIGYSDHVEGSESCYAAVTLGSKILEKHFTLDNNYSSFRDHKLSLNPKSMKNMILSCRKIEIMLGDYKKKISSQERKNIKKIRRSIYFKSNISKNTRLEMKHLKIVRPFKILKPNNLKYVIGKRLKKNVKDSELVKLSYLKS